MQLENIAQCTPSECKPERTLMRIDTGIGDQLLLVIIKHGIQGYLAKSTSANTGKVRSAANTQRGDRPSIGMKHIGQNSSKEKEFQGRI